jgi:hypothetical protein
MNQIIVRHQTEIIVPGKRLGRHVAIDVRRNSHGVRSLPRSAIKTIEWKRNVPIFDQGNVGSCEGDGAAGVLSTAPFTNKFDNAEAVKIYTLATQIDSIPGTYPQEDTGTDTTSAWNACRQLGLIKTFANAFSLTDILTALQTGPGDVGWDWYEGFDSPDSKGIVKPTGQIRGGHCIECVGCDCENGLLKFANSWGTSWGADGYFYISFEHAEAMMATDGDSIFPALP